MPLILYKLGHMDMFEVNCNVKFITCMSMGIDSGRRTVFAHSCLEEVIQLSIAFSSGAVILDQTNT